MAIATFCSRILGLVREQVLAFSFGASGFTDAFLIAYRIPNLLRDLFAEGAFSSAFVPTFVEASQRGREEARKLFWSLFILLTLLTLSISLVIYIFAPELIHLFAPTFYKDPEKFQLTVTLTRIMAPFLCLVSLAALFMGVLNSLKVFFIPSFAPVFFNVAMIGSMLAFPPILISKGLHPAISLGIGVILGGLLQALVQFPLILKNGYGPKKPDKLFTNDTKKVFKLLGPGLVGFAATQINLLVNTILASGTIVGAVSWLSFAFRLFQLPVGILSVSIGNSNLVHFSNAWKAGNKEEAKELLTSSFFLSCFMVFPAMIALIMCSNEMINVIFERGKFDTYSTFMTAKALKWYALGLPFYSIYKIFVPTFYAIDRQKIPVYCSIFGIAFNILFCTLLVDNYGFEVLAIGTTLSMFLNSFLQGVILKKDLQMESDQFINLRFHKLIAGAICSGLSIFYLKSFFNFYEMPFIYRCSTLVLYLFTIAFVYFVVCVILGERALVTSVINKISKRKR